MAVIRSSDDKLPSLGETDHELRSQCDRANLNPLCKKIEKILNTRLETDKDSMGALKDLSTFFKDNTLQSRRNLRGQIEKRTVGINEEFVNALCIVKVAVDDIYNEVNMMNKDCSDMKKRLQLTKSETRHLIKQTNFIQEQSQKLLMQGEVVTLFQEAFQLNSEEVLDLKGSSRDSPITPQFFSALTKTQKIKDNTKYLLQTGHQKTALDILEQLNVMREIGLDRLFRWFQFQSRTHDLSPLIAQALAVLQERPVLFKMALEEWIVVRRGWLTRGFLDALTLGGPRSAPRPIELQAHDPLRYIGDMLAWVHQALPNEREASQLMFSKCIDIDKQKHVEQTVSSVSDGVCRPIKTRIEQMIVSEQCKGDHLGSKKPVQLYKISSLLHFYMSIIYQVTGNSILVSTLEELQQLSYKMFLSALQNQVNQTCERVEPPGEALSPCTGFAKTLSLLTEVVTAATVSDDTSHDFRQIVDCVVDSLVNAVSESGASLGSIDCAVYLLNCFHQLYSTLNLLHTSSEKLQIIQSLIDDKMAALIKEQVNSVFHALGLATIYSVIAINPPPSQLSAHPACQPLAIQSFVTNLEKFLAAPDYLMFPQTRCLLSSPFRKQLHISTAQAVVATYSQLYSLVHKPQNGFQDPSSLMPNSPDIVRSLLL